MRGREDHGKEAGVSWVLCREDTGDQGQSSSTEPWLSSATVLLGVYPARPHGQKFT